MLFEPKNDEPPALERLELRQLVALATPAGMAETPWEARAALPPVGPLGEDVGGDLMALEDGEDQPTVPKGQMEAEIRHVFDRCS